jgi:hypothetical protein
MGLLESLRLFLELFERVHSAILETKLASTNKASRTVPIITGRAFDRWLKAITVKGVVAAITYQYAA